MNDKSVDRAPRGVAAAAAVVTMASVHVALILSPSFVFRGAPDTSTSASRRTCVVCHSICPTPCTCVLSVSVCFCICVSIHARASIPHKPMMHIAFSPYFRQIYTFPPPHISTKCTFLLNLLFCFPLYASCFTLLHDTLVFMQVSFLALLYLSVCVCFLLTNSVASVSAEFFIKRFFTFTLTPSRSGYTVLSSFYIYM